MQVGAIAEYLETWAPLWTAWERDAVGLQLGDPARPVRVAGVALDLTDDVVSEAVRKKADLIICHHPPLFHPQQHITSATPIGRRLLRLAEHRVAVYAAHTNLDSARGGVNFALAEALGLRNVSFLSPLAGALAKLAVFVPEGHEDTVIGALAGAGAGVIGEYSHCTFRTRGVGTFKPGTAANPYIGSAGTLEHAPEYRIEAVVPRALVAQTVAAVRAVHPYDEMAYDVYPVDTPDTSSGIGAVGDLPRPMTFAAFARRVKSRLRAGHLRTAGSVRTVRRVAVCGGSGRAYVERARAAGADVYVTADLSYHTFEAATRSFALIDAGHWETEHPVLPVVAARLKQELRRRKERCTIYVTRIRTNPIHTV